MLHLSIPYPEFLIRVGIAGKTSENQKSSATNFDHRNTRSVCFVFPTVFIPL